MKREHSTIFHLVALGRINGAEAERLLMACNEGREVGWVMAAALIVFTVSQAHLPAGVEGALRALPVVAPRLLHHALVCVTGLLGGVL